MLNTIKSVVKKIVLHEQTRNKTNVEPAIVDPIRCVADNSGWTYEDAERQMNDAREYLRVSFSDYLRYEFYKLSLEEQAEQYKNILLTKKNPSKAKIETLDKILNKKSLEETIDKVVIATGWTPEKAKQEILESRRHTGCAYKEYVYHRFYEISPEIQDQFFLIHDNKKLVRKYNTDKEFRKICRDKAKTNEFFVEYLKRPWCINTKITLDEFIEKFSTCKKIIYKPLEGSKGSGINAFELNSSNIEAVYSCIKEKEAGTIEEYIVQHPEMNKLYSTSVNTLRIVTISSFSDSESNNESYIEVLYVAFRTGIGGENIVDNLSSGGIIMVADIETGIIITDGADMQGNSYEHHPQSGVKIKGFAIPLFNDALNMVKDAISKKRINGYYGWDVAITEDGPVLIEINSIPGASAVQIPFGLEGKGMKHIISPYLS